jgi:hypothetical protein
LAVNAADIATPEPLVVAVFTPPTKLQEAPLPGAVKVTVAPLTGTPAELVTVTIKGLPNAVLMVALCGVPLITVIAAATLPDWLVSENRAVLDTPATLAVTR